jgi:RNA polymerase sigma factor (sigma-70 family)
MADDADDDDALLQRVRQGDGRAWDVLYRKYTGLVHWIIVRSGQLDPDEVDDLCQDVWVKVSLNFDRFRSEAPFKVWLGRIAKNVVVDAARKRIRRGTTESIDDDFGLPKGVTNWSAGDLVKACENQELVRKGLEPLTHDQRQILYLKHGVDLQLADIAELMGLTSSEAAISQRLKRAETAFRKALDRLRPKGK